LSNLDKSFTFVARACKRGISTGCRGPSSCLRHGRPVSPSLQDIADTFGDLTGMRFQREMARVEEADDSPRNIALERLGTGGRKKGSFLPQAARNGG
jgi:hypothetical protein